LAALWLFGANFSWKTGRFFKGVLHPLVSRNFSQKVHKKKRVSSLAVFAVSKEIPEVGSEAYSLYFGKSNCGINCENQNLSSEKMILPVW